MQGESFNIDFNKIYPNPLIQRLKAQNNELDLDAFQIDFNHDEPNLLFLGADYDQPSIGAFLDALFYCLALNDIDVKEYKVTEEHQDIFPIIYKIEILDVF